MIRNVVVAAAMAGACARPSPEQQIVNDAAAALGGRDRVLAVKSIVLEGQGMNGNLGQDLTPDATGQTFAITDYTRVVDFDGGGARTTQTRTPRFAYFQGPAPQRQVQGIDGDVAYNIGANGTATRAANLVAAERRAELLHHPLAILRAAFDPGTTLTQAHTSNGERVVDLVTANDLRLTLAIDSATHLPTRITSMTDQPNLGDVAMETSFADYQEIGGVKLPTKITTTLDGIMTAEIQVSSQAVNGDTADLAAPPAAASAAPVTGPPPATVAVTELAPGVWWLAGQSHHSVAVEFADHLTLFEAPQNEVRTLAVIARARELRPGKPLTEVIVSHHHFDHSGGLRAAISQGLTVITHRAAAEYYQDLAERTHAIAPDALAGQPRNFKVVAVDGELPLTDRTRSMTLYAVPDTQHADTMLVAYLPKERILIEADLFTPGAAVNVFAASLRQAVEAHRLRVDRIVPIHGAVAPYAALLEVAPR